MSNRPLFEPADGTGTIRIPDGRTKGHICGNCRWENKGREDCPNNTVEPVEPQRRASQEAPYIPSKDWRHYPQPDYPESPHGPL